MRALGQEIRYAMRQLLRSPGFAFTAIITLALGIGANTAIFTLVRELLLKNLPVADPKMLVRLGDHGDCCVNTGFPVGDRYSLFAYDLYLQLKSSAGSDLEQLAAMQAGQDTFTVRGAQPGAVAKSTGAEFVSGNYFQTLGLRPYAGRLLVDSDDRPGAPPVVVLSYAMWQDEFGQSMSVLGSTIQLDTHPVTIVGVTPPAFYGDRMTSAPPSLYMPIAVEPVMHVQPYIHNREQNWLYLLGRLRPGADQAALGGRLNAALRGYLRTLPEYEKAERARSLAASYTPIVPGGAGVGRMQAEYGRGLHLLTALSAVVLLVACANLANLLLVRGMARAGEISLRIALGAARVRIVRQLVVESLLLSCLGGLAGLLVAYGGARMLLALTFPDAKQMPVSPVPSGSILLFSLALSLLTGLLFGLLPAWITSRAQPVDALRGAHRTTGDGAPVLQRVLVVGQASLSLVLLVIAGLLAGSLRNLQHQELGFQTVNRIVVHIDPEAAGYKPAQLESLYQQLLDRFGALPGVKRASISLYSPLENNAWGEGVWVAGRPEPRPGDHIGAEWVRISPSFFDVVGQPIVRGRNIQQADTATSPAVAVVNEAFARRFFPAGVDPIGHTFGTGGMESVHDMTIVGVVRDAKYSDPREPAGPMYFRPLLQVSSRDPSIETRSLFVNNVMLELTGPQQGMEGAVRRTLAEINPNLTVVDYNTFERQISEQFNQERLLATLTELFGALALGLAAVGLYGVTSYTVARRSGEIGVRMALGAPRASVMRMVLRGALLQAGLGLAIGVPVALLTSRFLAAQLWGLAGGDLRILLGATVTLAAAACVAGVIPASRAASIDPLEAMRTE